MTVHTLTPKQSQLIAKWNAVYDGSEQALNWIAQARQNAPRLDAEADDFNLKLYRARNLARSLQRVAGTPMTVGFFGLSQAGKSYLISALAADQDGELETDIGNSQTLNFIDHFNPVGSGKEATGLVTRFTCQSQPIEDANYPLQLRLFQEIEIAMILSNAWFKDFDQERVDFKISEDLIQRVLAPYDNLDTTQPVAGVSAEDIVALADYLHATSKNSVGKLEAHYWPRLIKIAPYLSIAQRADVFSILWGQQALLSKTYVELSTALHKVGLADTVYAPISVLVQSRGEALVQSNSIMNVDTLNLLLTPRDTFVQVRPMLNGQLGQAQSILTAQLTALTTEMVFPLASAPKNKIVEEVDLLDFPGYRTRQQFIKIEDAATSDSDASPVARLLLRGKVAYLFERYTTSQEMSALVMCTSSFKQSDVVTVGPVLTDWINNTQGATAEERQGRCGLIWALTMMDGFISNSLNLKTEQVPEACENMLKLTMMERFGNLNWMQEWDLGKPFNNTFFVRKPGLQTPFIQLDDQEREINFAEQYTGKLSELRQTLVATPSVARHVANPGEAWDAMLVLNDGGMARFTESFTNAANIDFKLDRIQQQWQQLDDSLTGGLKRWYQADGDAALDEKRAKAQLVLQGLGRYAASIGELMQYMAVPDDVLRNLYLSGVYEDNNSDASEDTASSSASLYSNDAGFDFGNIFSTETAAPVLENTTRKVTSHEQRFAKAVFSAWVGHLRDLAERTQVLNILSLKREVVSALVDEMITASYRFGLQDKLTEALLAHAQTGNRREQTVEKQILTTQIILQDYIAWLGNLDVPTSQRSKRHVNKAPGEVFDFYPQEGPTDLPQLPEDPEDPSRRYLMDWFSAVVEVTLNNAGHSQGREITLEQNNALGAVLQTFKAFQA